LQVVSRYPITDALASKGKVAFTPDPQVAFVEQMSLPWSDGRTAMIIYAPQIELFQRVGPCPAQGPLFDRLGGRITRIASCSDVVQVPEKENLVTGQERLPAEVTEADSQKQKNSPGCVSERLLLWVALAALLVVLVILWLRSRRRRQEY